MRSAKSSSRTRLFYPVLWKKNMLRFWPIWAVYGICWLFALTLEPLIARNGTIGGIPYARYFADVNVLEFIPVGGIMSALLFGILSAMAVFSYLYTGRSVGLFHALPVRREGLFLTNYLSGLSFMLLPSLVVFLLTVLVELVLGALNIGALCMWLAMQVLLSLFFFSFATFCAMFTGHILALPAFYLILNGLAVGVVLLINQVLQEFVFGFDSIHLMERIATWLSPAFQLFSRLYVETVWNDAGDALTRVAFHGLGFGLIYALAGLVLAGAALAIYRRRDLERAGDVVTVTWVRPVFKYGVAFCSALALGLLLYSFFESGLPQGAWPLLCFMVLCGCVGYFAAEMLLKKTFRVFGGSWKGCLVFTLCLIVLTAGMELDVTGYERRVPDPGRIAGVGLYNLYTAPYDDGRPNTIQSQDPETAQAVAQLHQAIVRERGIHESRDYVNSYETRARPDGTRLMVQTQGSVPIRLEYDLADGSTMSRNYTIWVTEEALQDPDSAASRLTALINRPELVEENYFRTLERHEYKLTGISLNLKDAESMYDTYPVPTAYRDELMAAVHDDIAAGRLGRRYLLEDQERMTNCYYSDLALSYSFTSDAHNESGETRVSITLQTTAVETLEVLREAGVLDEDHVLETQAEVWQRQDQENRDNNETVYAESAR